MNSSRQRIGINDNTKTWLTFIRFPNVNQQMLSLIFRIYFTCVITEVIKQTYVLNPVICTAEEKIISSR